MYDTNDRIAEELSNYCTDLREQLRDSKSTVTWLSEQKVLADQSLNNTLEISRVQKLAIEELEEAMAGTRTVLSHESEELANVQKELDELEYKYQGLRQELSDVKTGGEG
jgi:uncharacterized coiled-coil DUF342 family protein